MKYSTVFTLWVDRWPNKQTLAMRERLFPMPAGSGHHNWDPAKFGPLDLESQLPYPSNQITLSFKIHNFTRKNVNKCCVVAKTAYFISNYDIRMYWDI